MIPVGNGTLFLGAVKALEHLLESGAIVSMPRILAVQSEKCDPLLKAAQEGSRDNLPQDNDPGYDPDYQDDGGLGLVGHCHWSSYAGRRDPGVRL